MPATSGVPRQAPMAPVVRKPICLKADRAKLKAAAAAPIAGAKCENPWQDSRLVRSFSHRHSDRPERCGVQRRNLFPGPFRQNRQSI
jgi:hypothetical protein